MELSDLILGGGVIGLLIKISTDLGEIKSSFKHIMDTVSAHGVRISKLEEKVL